MAAMAPVEKTRNLHNFSLPPRLTWGSHKLLRCSSPPPDRKRRHPKNPSFRPGTRPSSTRRDDQIEAIREKLMLDLRSEVDKFRAAFLGNAPPPPPPPAEVRPWNLRTTRARGGTGVVAGERAMFSVELSKREIEDDFVRITGKRPAGKPKKRPRAVQRQMDTLFPGLWLSGITPDMYTVYEFPQVGK